MAQLISLEHPGVILKEEFMEPLEVTAYKLSQATGISGTAIGEITKGKRRITVVTGLKFARYFGVSDSYFVYLQTRYELDVAKEQSGESLEKVIPLQPKASGADVTDLLRA